MRWDEHLDRPIDEPPEYDDDDIVELSEATYRGVLLDLSAFSLVTFEDCVIESCQILASRDTEVRFVRCRVAWSDLTGVRIAGGCSRTAFVECKLVAVDVAGATLQDVEMTRTILTDVSMRDSTLRRVELRSCTIVDLDASSATLESVAFPESSVRGLDLDRARCTSVDLTEAAHLEVKRATSLRGCRISVPQTLDLAFSLALESGLFIDQGADVSS